MSGLAIGIIGMVLLLVLLALRVPVALAMFTIGLGGQALLNSPSAAIANLASDTFTLASQAELVVVPLFIFMGNIATETGMSRRLYDAAYAVIGRLRGGLAAATVIGCGGFAALSGSSVASALTMGRVSLAQMDRFNYDKGLSTGAVAAGGTLGILIPPSTGFVIYAILAQESIGRLFLAGVLPGLLLLSMFVLTIVVLCALDPSKGPKGPSTTMKEKALAIANAVPILAIILLTIGGIYGGIFSPTEASAVGAGLAIFFGLVRRTLTPQAFWNAARSSVITTAAVMLILIAAYTLIPFLALSRIPQSLGEFIIGLDLPVLGVLAMMLATYLVMGCFMEGFAMLVLSMPIFYPIVTQLGIDPIWFGVLVVLTLEMGLISPPVGINVYIVKSVAPDTTLNQIFKGILPYLLAMIATLIILIAFPQISLWLPNTMIGG